MNETANSSTLEGWSTFWQMSSVAFGLLIILLFAVQAVLVIAPLKWQQVRRVRARQRAFERELDDAEDTAGMTAVARVHPEAPGSRVLLEVVRVSNLRGAGQDELLGVARRALIDEQERLLRLMPTLAGLGAASPLIGLLGTVWGIIEAFLKIAAERSSEMAVIAPAMSGALLTTALGLAAAIPAVLAYNYLDARIQSLHEGLDTLAQSWAGRLAAGGHRSS